MAQHFHDVIPPEKGKKSIRDVPIPARRQNKIDELLEEKDSFYPPHYHQPKEDKKPDRPTMEDYDGREAEERAQHSIKKVRKINNSDGKKIKKRSRVWAFVFVLIIVVAMAMLFLFKRAEVTLTLNSETVPIDLRTMASADAAVGTPGILPYKTMTVQKDGELAINATGTPVMVQKKATGSVTLYNTSDTAQTLIATTRIETPTGMIFHLNTGATVPSQKTVNGHAVPGSVNVLVTADETGSSYNIPQSDFVVTAFKGTPKASGFYGRSTTAMSGGFSGMMTPVSPAVEKAATQTLQATLVSQATDELTKTKPSNGLFFQSGIDTRNFTSHIETGTSGTPVLKGTLVAVGLIFDKTDLTDLLSEKLSKQYSFDNLESLNLVVQYGSSATSTPTTSSPSFLSNPPLVLLLNGTLTTGHNFDSAPLRKALASKSKEQLKEILKMYPEITKAEAVLHPFWSNSFPDNPNNITVVVTK